MGLAQSDWSIFGQLDVTLLFSCKNHEQESAEESNDWAETSITSIMIVTIRRSLLFGRGITSDHLNDDCLRRGLDILWKIDPSRIFRMVADGVRIKDRLGVPFFLFDMTTRVLYGQYGFEEAPSAETEKAETPSSLKVEVVSAAPACPKGKLGLSIWCSVLLEKFAFHRPLGNLLKSWRQEGLSLSCGTITSGLPFLSPLFVPL